MWVGISQVFLMGNKINIERQPEMQAKSDSQVCPTWNRRWTGWFSKVIWFLENTLWNRQLYNVKWLKDFEIPGKFIKNILALKKKYIPA